MRMKISILWLALLVPWLLLRGQGLADQRPGQHTHDGKAPQEQTMEGHTHKHDTWETPPAAYASARSTRWGDPAAVARGEPLFQTHCMVCHGTDGKGGGPRSRRPAACPGRPHAPLSSGSRQRGCVSLLARERRRSSRAVQIHAVDDAGL